MDISCEGFVTHDWVSGRAAMVSEVKEVTGVMLLEGSGLCNKLERLCLSKKTVEEHNVL